MKNLLVAVAATFALTGAASAFDLGYGLTAGGEIDTNYTTGIGEWAVDFEPEVGLALYGVAITASTEIDIIKLNDGDLFQGLDFEATYDIGATGLTAYSEVSTDKDLEFGDFTVGTRLKF